MGRQVLAQGHAGMWILHGKLIADQQYAYSGPSIRAGTHLVDLLAVHIAACILPPAHFLGTVQVSLSLSPPPLLPPPSSPSLPNPASPSPSLGSVALAQRHSRLCLAMAGMGGG